MGSCTKRDTEVSRKVDNKVAEIVGSKDLGVSFSIKTCRDYGIDWEECLNELIASGIKRFRIMSYWDLHEPAIGVVDLSLLTKQLDIIEAAGGLVTLCLGMRQPRWPETHLPSWAIGLNEDRREKLFTEYLTKVVADYKDRACIQSYQLENEFWNKNFGEHNTFSRDRLIREFELVRRLDPTRPIIMTLGNTTGYPIGKPKADLYGTTLYRIQYEKLRYSRSKYPSWYFKIRRRLTLIISRKNLIIHELQAEPWGPKANWEMSDDEQAKSMDATKLAVVLDFADKTGILYKDLWGGEWWYWRKVTRGDDSLLQVISEYARKGQVG